MPEWSYVFILCPGNCQEKLGSNSKEMNRKKKTFVFRVKMAFLMFDETVRDNNGNK